MHFYWSSTIMKYHTKKKISTISKTSSNSLCRSEHKAKKEKTCYEMHQWLRSRPYRMPQFHDNTEYVYLILFYFLWSIPHRFAARALYGFRNLSHGELGDNSEYLYKNWYWYRRSIDVVIDQIDSLRCLHNLHIYICINVSKQIWYFPDKRHFSVHT